MWALCNDEPYDLYALQNIRVIKSRRNRQMVHVARTGKERNACSVFVGKLKERPLGRPRFGWEYNIKMDKL
jgi:hypothetical protein